MDLPPDRILIRDLALRCIVGINPEERREKQDVRISIELACDCAPAAESDRIEDAVDYKAIKQRVRTMVEASDFGLLETLADRIARIALEDPRVAEAVVTVDKPGALRFARSVAVRIVRRR